MNGMKQIYFIAIENLTVDSNKMLDKIIENYRIDS